MSVPMHLATLIEMGERLVTQPLAVRNALQALADAQTMEQASASLSALPDHTFVSLLAIMKELDDKTDAVFNVWIDLVYEVGETRLQERRGNALPTAPSFTQADVDAMTRPSLPVAPNLQTPVGYAPPMPPAYAQDPQGAMLAAMQAQMQQLQSMMQQAGMPVPPSYGQQLAMPGGAPRAAVLPSGHVRPVAPPPQIDEPPYCYRAFWRDVEGGVGEVGIWHTNEANAKKDAAAMKRKHTAKQNARRAYEVEAAYPPPGEKITD